MLVARALLAPKITYPKCDHIYAQDHLGALFRRAVVRSESLEVFYERPGAAGNHPDHLPGALVSACTPPLTFAALAASMTRTTFDHCESPPARMETPNFASFAA